MRTSFRNSIQERLNVGTFKLVDFDITERSEGRGYGFVISYRYEPSFKISATISNDGEAVMGQIAPGQLSATEHFKVTGGRAFLQLLSEWVTRIEEDLSAVPLARQIEEQRRQIDDLVRQWQALPNEYFTQEEASQLASRLEALEQDLKVRLAGLEMDETRLKAKIKEVERDMQFLKTELENQKKPSWARAFAARCVGWMRDSENRALLKDSVEIGRKLLGDGTAT